MKLDFDLQHACEGACLPTADSVEAWLRAALQGRRKTAALSVRIVGEDEMRHLNATWRGQDKTTNVLSFPVDLPPGVAPEQLGDIVICAPVVESEARLQGKAPADHWAHLVIHGALHLLGFDHENDADAELMEALETDILSTLAIADPYRNHQRTHPSTLLTAGGQHPKP